MTTVAYSPSFFEHLADHDTRSTLLSGMSAETHDAVPVCQVFRNIDLLPARFHDTIAGLVHSADFRSLTSLDDQMHFFKQHTKLPLEMIGTLVDKSKSTVHRHLAAKSTVGRSDATAEPKEAKRGPNSHLTLKDEERVIEWIEERQRQQNCASPAEVREFAFSVKSEARGETVVGGEHMSRDWWRSFKKTYEQRIGIKVATSREHARTRCRDVDVREYFAKMASVITKIKSLKQLINMDETGFHSRMDRNRRRKCVYSKSCDTFVTYSEETASTTLSMMVTISANGEALPPMFVCRENVTFRSTELRKIKDRVYVSRSQKGYASEANMLAWIEQILKAYVQAISEQLPDPTDKVYLVMDNCGIHNTARVKSEMAKIERLEIVWFPPHTSHFLQMLDASIFGVLKTQFRNLRSPQTSPKIEGKIFRAFRAFWISAFPTTVMSCFEMTGFDYVVAATGVSKLVLEQKKVEDLITANCLRVDNQRDQEGRDGHFS